MRHLLWRLMAGLSRALSRATGGKPGHTLCRRVAVRYGYDCLFCRIIATMLQDRDHCLDELSAREIVELAKRRK